MAKKKSLPPESYERQIAPIRKHQKKAKVPGKSKNKNTNLHVDFETYSALAQIPCWQDKAREAIAQMIAKELGIYLPQ